jgi:hypothetical protein
LLLLLHSLIPSLLLKKQQQGLTDLLEAESRPLAACLSPEEHVSRLFSASSNFFVRSFASPHFWAEIGKNFFSSFPSSLFSSTSFTQKQQNKLRDGDRDDNLAAQSPPPQLQPQQHSQHNH